MPVRRAWYVERWQGETLLYYQRFADLEGAKAYAVSAWPFSLLKDHPGSVPGYRYVIRAYEEHYSMRTVSKRNSIYICSWDPKEGHPSWNRGEAGTPYHL